MGLIKSIIKEIRKGINLFFDIPSATALILLMISLLMCRLSTVTKHYNLFINLSFIFAIASICVMFRMWENWEKLEK